MPDQLRDQVPERVLVVDAANVVGSRPDGWWRDRAGAAERLLAALAPMAGGEVAGPTGAVRLGAVHVVLEGAARAAGRDRATGGGGGGSALVVVRADRDGDTAVVEVARRLLGEGAVPLVVTADRGLRERLPDGAEVAGAGWLNGLLGR